MGAADCQKTAEAVGEVTVPRIFIRTRRLCRLRRAIGRGKAAPTLPPGRRSRAAQANLGTAGLHIAPAQGTGGDAQMRASTAQGQAPGHDRFIGALLVGQIRHIGLQIGFQLGRRGKNGFA